LYALRTKSKIAARGSADACATAYGRRNSPIVVIHAAPGSRIDARSRSAGVGHAYA
jgi:hypothetical protein